MTIRSRKPRTEDLSIQAEILGTGQLWRRAYYDRRRHREAAALAAASISSAGVVAFGLLLSVI